MSQTVMPFGTEQLLMNSVPKDWIFYLFHIIHGYKFKLLYGGGIVVKDLGCNP